MDPDFFEDEASWFGGFLLLVFKMKGVMHMEWKVNTNFLNKMLSESILICHWNIGNTEILFKRILWGEKAYNCN